MIDHQVFEEPGRKGHKTAGGLVRPHPALGVEGSPTLASFKCSTSPPKLCLSSRLILSYLLPSQSCSSTQEKIFKHPSTAQNGS